MSSPLSIKKVWRFRHIFLAFSKCMNFKGGSSHKVFHIACFLKKVELLNLSNSSLPNKKDNKICSALKLSVDFLFL